jgi:hypothetical protein
MSSFALTYVRWLGAIGVAVLLLALFAFVRGIWVFRQYDSLPISTGDIEFFFIKPGIRNDGVKFVDIEMSVKVINGSARQLGNDWLSNNISVIIDNKTTNHEIRSIINHDNTSAGFGLDRTFAFTARFLVDGQTSSLASANLSLSDLPQLVSVEIRDPLMQIRMSAPQSGSPQP